jgi:pantoate kinase
MVFPVCVCVYPTGKGGLGLSGAKCLETLTDTAERAKITVEKMKKICERYEGIAQRSWATPILFT